MDDFRVRFGRHVAELRRTRKLTQEQLATRTGVAERTIRRIELGENAPGFDLLPKLAMALRVSVRELFDF
ncbi:helix-turn-helix domain-containing protein [Microbulbifer taiwanensis]|uniref:Helix-turn-helix domain-containing protein n=1 Tax=Microbulbifer taiwanensis TaxID=986746 RepID=A0ABW1YQ32_9GAMM|nr:helix-turn-helix transcriptional regulator [Microbulbifer taiwanensis]